jgi:asparagine synthase (glutamine-hydrolysing)
MCGIAGIINYEGHNLDNIMQALRHRGPDNQTVYTHENVALIHARLAIQDIEHGVQPFHYLHYSIVFNGEIYNHLELRKNLSEFTFKTHSDTETLLYLFVKYQYKMFDLLDGMFAFCIYDHKENKITLARDRAGKKPLYYLSETNKFIFSSELNTLKKAKKLIIDEEALHCYFRAGYIWKPYTPYKNVLEVEAGSFLVVDVATCQYKKQTYFNLEKYYEKEPTSASFTETLQQLDHYLKKSVQDRLMTSDVEVGVFLSGGIDSNLIAAMAAQVKPNIKTFTVKFDGLYDESALARLTANKYGTDHIELNVSSNLKNDIENILCAYGEPFMDSSAIPSYYVSKAASSYVKVVLGGDGADELFGGYRRYVPAAHAFTTYFKHISKIVNVLPKPKTKQSLYNYLFRLLSMANKKDVDYYLSATTDIFEDVHIIKRDKASKELATFITDVYANNNLTSLNKMLYADFSALLFCDLLVKMDIASMANSLEVRSPFLSKYLLEFAPSLPGNYKINKLQTKYILRKLSEKYLPQELINQPKRGFEVPLKKWVNHDLRENIHAGLQPGAYAEHFVDKKFIANILADKVPVSPEKRAKMLWSLYCFEVWHKNEAVYNVHS